MTIGIDWQTIGLVMIILLAVCGFAAAITTALSYNQPKSKPAKSRKDSKRVRVRMGYYK